MKRLALHVAVLGATAIALGACQEKPAGQFMSGAEVRAAFDGNTLHGTSVNGDFVIYVAPDGAVRGLLWGGRHDTGTSTIADDGRFCVTWHQTDDGATICRTVRRAAAGYELLNPDGIVFATVKPSVGNTDGL